MLVTRFLPLLDTLALFTFTVVAYNLPISTPTKPVIVITVPLPLAESVVPLAPEVTVEVVGEDPVVK